jgi:hypothetical protein
VFGRVEGLITHLPDRAVTWGAGQAVGMNEAQAEGEAQSSVKQATGQIQQGMMQGARFAAVKAGGRKKSAANPPDKTKPPKDDSSGGGSSDTANNEYLTGSSD